MIHRMLAWLAVSFYRQLLELFRLMNEWMIKYLSECNNKFF